MMKKLSQRTLEAIALALTQAETEDGLRIHLTPRQALNEAILEMFPVFPESRVGDTIKQATPAAEHTFDVSPDGMWDLRWDARTREFSIRFDPRWFSERDDHQKLMELVEGAHLELGMRLPRLEADLLFMCQRLSQVARQGKLL